MIHAFSRKKFIFVATLCLLFCATIAGVFVCAHLAMFFLSDWYRTRFIMSHTAPLSQEIVTIEKSADERLYEAVRADGKKYSIAAVSSATVDLEMMIHTKVKIHARVVVGSDIVIQQCPHAGRVIGKRWCQKTSGEALVIDTMQAL